MGHKYHNKTIWDPWFETGPVLIYDDKSSLKYLQMEAVMYLKLMTVETKQAQLLSNTAMLDLLGGGGGGGGNVYYQTWSVDDSSCLDI